MIIVTIRSDKPEAEIGIYDGTKQVAYETWQAHRKLAETLHTKIERLLETKGLGWSDIEGIGAYVGPGSFTGLRIGLSVANALAASYGVPCAGGTGEDWLKDTLDRLVDRSAGSLPLVPEYGAPVHITLPKR